MCLALVSIGLREVDGVIFYDSHRYSLQNLVCNPRDDQGSITSRTDTFVFGYLATFSRAQGNWITVDFFRVLWLFQTK